VAYRVGQDLRGEQAGGIRQFRLVPGREDVPDKPPARGDLLGPGLQGGRDAVQRRGGRAREQQGHVVGGSVGLRQQRGQDLVRGQAQPRRGGEDRPQLGLERLDPGPDIGVAGLDQPVGVQDQRRAVRRRQRRLLMRDVADAERDADRNGQPADRAVRPCQQHREVPGGAGGHLALAGVDDQVAAGDELAGQVADDGVQGVEQLLWRHAGPGQGVGRRPQLAHHRGRLQAPAHHVADQHPRAPGAERDQVEPVTADAAGRGQVAAGRLYPANLGR
jgi:hypothetical protein